jgi:hypothetical protein
LVAGVAALVCFPLLLFDRTGNTLAGGHPAAPSRAAFSVAISAGIVALFVALGIGLPLALWLTKRGRVSVVTAVLCGLLIGNVPFLMGVLLAGTYGVAGFLRGSAFSSLLGMAGAATFWLVALRAPTVPSNLS